MKRRFNKISVTLLFCILLLSGCNSNPSKQQVGDSNQQMQGILTEEPKQDESAKTEIENGDETGKQGKSADENASTGSDRSESEDAEATISQVIPPVTVEVPIYTMNTETMETKATVASVSEETEITAELIVQLVISDIADKSYVIEVNQVSIEDSYAVIDFSSKTPPVVNVGDKTEGTILDALAFSLLDNLEECKGVIFRVDGKAYVSENFSFEKNEIYLSR